MKVMGNEIMRLIRFVVSISENYELEAINLDKNLKLKVSSKPQDNLKIKSKK